MQDLLDRIAACRTEADHYVVQIHAENHLTPREAIDLAARADTLPETACIWVERLAEYVRRVRPAPEPYRRRDIAEHVTLYAGEGPAGAPRDLVVGFSGVGMRLMMPVAPVLQAFPAARCDVLVLSDPARLHFLRGIGDYAADLEALAMRLDRDLPLSRYAALRCFGTSAGGASALAFGAKLGARVAISLGGAHPVVLPAARTGGNPIDRYAFDRMIAAAPPGRTRMLCIFPEKYKRDGLRTRLQAIGVPGARAVAVAGSTHHAVIATLFLTDTMVRFFEEMLLSDDPPDGALWTP